VKANRPMTHRYFVKGAVESGSCRRSRMNRGDTCLRPGGSRCIGGMNSTQALVWNVRTSFWMRREMTSGRHHEEEYRCQSEGRGCS
jgi:hypothetical protein